MKCPPQGSHRVLPVRAGSRGSHSVIGRMLAATTTTIETSTATATTTATTSPPPPPTTPT
eukprot:9081718-Pyramimonas_sp.AAC.1